VAEVWSSAALCSVIALSALSASACGGKSEQAGAEASDPTPGDASGLLASGDFRVVAARSDGSRIAYLSEAALELWAVAPGEKPAPLLNYTASGFEAHFAEHADVLVAAQSGATLTRIAFGSGTQVIAEAATLSAISADGDVVVYRDDLSGEIVVWRRDEPEISLGAVTSNVAAATERFVIACTAAALVALDRETEEIHSLGTAQSFLLSADGATIAFVEPIDDAAEVRIVDVESGAVVLREPSGGMLTLDPEGSTLFYVDAENQLRRAPMSGGASTVFGSANMLTSAHPFAVAPDRTKISFRPAWGDYETGLFVEAEGGDIVFNTIIPTGGGSNFFRGPSSMMVHAGCPCNGSYQAPFRLTVAEFGGGGRQVTDQAYRYEPLFADADGLLFQTKGAKYGDVYVASASTGVTNQVGVEIGNFIQVSERRLAADAHGEAPGVYLLDVPTP